MVAIVLTAASCATSPAPAGRDRVTAAVLPYLNMMPFHIAAEEGYFAGQNLDVEFVTLGRTQEIMTALARGEVDAAGGMVTVTELNLMASDTPVRTVADLGHLSPEACPFNAFLVRRDLLASGALDDPARARALTVDADIFIGFGYFLDELLGPLGLTIDDLELVNIPSPAALEALPNGSIDVTIDSEPFVTMHLDRGAAAIWTPTAAVAPDYVISAVMYGPGLLVDRPDVGYRFTVAMLEAIRQYGQGKTPRNVDIVARATGLDRGLVERACWPTVGDDARVDPRVFLGFERWALDHDLIGRVLDDEELFDPRFIDAANAALSR